MKRLNYENGALDDVDAAILEMLVANARVTTAELARAVGLSAPTVAERVKRLEEADVITGYSAAVSPAAMGLPISVYFRIRPVPGELERVAAILRDIPEITECDRVTGEDCFLARASLASVADMERVIDLIIPYAMTNTSIVQSSPFARRLPPFPRRGRTA
ncbi:Lrp/AsnC family transcriptional regulator [Nitratireductor thuwali]|uniref:HTH-type transcriptional regulator LrpC n=1 Tax=Nitratireductor thuwali TaxID=2267699 RepID=A0ABY5MPZ3_9HYPH|nr:HTH-type transcriptional regulator LrpC [Nitratireductor thuwali]